MQPQSPQYGNVSPQGYGPGQVPPNQYPLQPEAASARKKHFNWLIIPLIIFILLFLGASGFALWAYSGMQDYKNNVDGKIKDAVEIAKQQTATEKDKEFVEEEKKPYKEYKSPSTFASVNIIYPKTWAAFVTETDKASVPVDGYFHPQFVPGLQSGTDFALKVQVSNQSYDQELKQLEPKVKQGKVRISPYKAPKVPEELGARIEGEINTGQKNIMVLFKVRDKTLKISTESEQFRGDFDNIILANLTFVP